MKLAGVSVGFVLGVAAVLLMEQTGAKKEGQMGTQLLTMRGSADPTGKVLTAYGEMDEPMLGVIGRTVKYVTRVIDQDHRFFEIYDLHASDDYKVVEIEYTRRR